MGGGISYVTQPGNIIGSTVVVSPAVPVVYTVTGVDVNGCVNTGTVQVGINPSVTAVVNSPSACAGSALGLASGGGASYFWTGPSSFTSNVQNPIIPNVGPVNAGAYTVVVTSAVGCTNSAILHASVTVVPAPVIQSNALPGGICFGQTLTLQGSGGGTGSYIWSGPNSFSSAVQNPSINTVGLPANGVYSLVTTINTCSVMATQAIVVNPLPNPTLTSNSPICIYKSLQLSATGAVNYTIAGPYGYITNNPNEFLPVANNLSAGLYTVTASDVNGCINTSTAIVVINGLPVIAVVGSSVCLNKTIGLSAAGGTAYSWVGPGFTSETATNTIPNADPSMAGQYEVTVTDIHGCISTSVTNVSVYALPSPTAVANTPICSGRDIKLTGGDPLAVSYLWQGPNGYYSIQKNPIIGQADLNFAGSYTFTATDPHGCSGSAITSMVINESPSASIVSGKNKGCVPICVSFSCQNTSKSTSTLQGVTWKLGDGSVLGTGLSVNDCFRNAGNYYVSAYFSDQNGCSSKSSSFLVEAYPIPVADFNFAPAKPIVNEEIELSDASQNATIKEWNWYFTNQKSNLNFSSNPKAFYENAGAYPIALVVKSDKGCMDTITKSVSVGEDFNIYVPNVFSPNGDGVNETFQPKGYGIVKYEMNIFNRWGEKLFTTTDFTQGWDGSNQKKAKESVQEGVYVWRIQYTNVFGKSAELHGTVSLLK
jgi:gliding motility-associated-like protein